LNVITDIKPQKRQSDRADIYLDNKLAFSLSSAIIHKIGLRIEQNLSASEVEELIQEDHAQTAFDAALHFLGYRPRSEAEIRARLRRRKFDERPIENAIQRLEEQGLIDDLAFAQFWRENRDSFSPRSKRLLEMELRTKGVPPHVIEDTLESSDDQLNAYRAGAKKARALQALEYSAFREKLVALLQRRGFGYDVIGSTVERLWSEREKAGTGNGL
jgi:regulatory protein